MRLSPFHRFSCPRLGIDIHCTSLATCAIPSQVSSSLKRQASSTLNQRNSRPASRVPDLAPPPVAQQAHHLLLMPLKSTCPMLSSWVPCHLSSQRFPHCTKTVGCSTATSRWMPAVSPCRRSLPMVGPLPMAGSLGSLSLALPHLYMAYSCRRSLLSLELF